MDIPEIDFHPSEKWSDEVGEYFIRATNDVVDVQTRYCNVISNIFVAAEGLINNRITYNSFKGSIDALRPPK